MVSIDYAWFRACRHDTLTCEYVYFLVIRDIYGKCFRYLGLGTGGYLGLYFGGMVAASLYDLIRRRNDPYYVSIGASGAVSAVLFTSIFLDPWGKILFFAVLPVPGIVFGVIYLAYCQYMARKAGDNVNHNAHFYGALYGLIYPAILEPSLIKRFYLSLFS